MNSFFIKDFVQLGGSIFDTLERPHPEFSHWYLTWFILDAFQYMFSFETDFPKLQGRFTLNNPLINNLTAICMKQSWRISIMHGLFYIVHDICYTSLLHPNKQVTRFNKYTNESSESECNITLTITASIPAIMIVNCSTSVQMTAFNPPWRDSSRWEVHILAIIRIYVLRKESTKGRYMWPVPKGNQMS